MNDEMNSPFDDDDDDRDDGDNHVDDFDDFDNIIECSSDSTEYDALHTAFPIDTQNDATEIPKVIHVCSICFRQYELQEDLRGHMIEFHKCIPKVEKCDENPILNENPNNKPLENDPELNVPEIVDESNDARNVLPVLEQRPVAFKDFRSILRLKLALRCTKAVCCVYKFASKKQLETHISCHKDATNRNFKCLQCNFETLKWRQCSAHLWKVHKIDVDLLQCPMCEFKASASVIVWRHMRVHKKWRPRVLRSLNVAQNKRAPNLQKLRESKRQQQSALPAQTPTPPPPPPKKNKYYSEKTCDICHRKFVNGKTLSKHVKTVHNKIKPFICNVCGRKTARKASLIIHMRQHTGEKPLQCKICKFSTRDPSVLHKHQLQHGKANKFKCTLCDYSCIQTGSYKRHVRLNHPAEYKKISCDLCSYVTISAEKLETHKGDHRNGLIENNEDSMDATCTGNFKNPRKLLDKNNEISADCFLPLESIDSLPHEPAVDTGGVTIPAPSEDTQFPIYLNH